MKKDTDSAERSAAPRRKRDWKRIVGTILFVVLLFSIGYSVYHIIVSPPDSDTPANVTSRSDYVLMLLQCTLGLVVMFLPSFLHKRWSITIPNYMYILYFVFLYCAIYLGEVRSFFYVIPHWDTYLHAFSGAMLGALGFTLVTLLNDDKSVAVSLSPKFVALFAFCFALAAGAVWEIYEFTGDGLLGLNMQKYRLADGTLLVGHAALSDTMKDIIIDALSALLVSVIGYFGLKSGRHSLLESEDAQPESVQEMVVEGLEDDLKKRSEKLRGDVHRAAGDKRARDES